MCRWRAQSAVVRSCPFVFPGVGLTRRRIQVLRDLKDVFGATFKIAQVEGQVMLSCMGTGYVNANRTIA